MNAHLASYATADFDVSVPEVACAAAYDARVQNMAPPKDKSVPNEDVEQTLVPCETRVGGMSRKALK